MVLQALLWANDCWAGLASYQDFCCSAANRSVEGRRSQGHLDGCFSGLSPLERQEMPPERPRAVQRSLHGPQREHCIDASDSDAIAPVTHVVHVVEAEDVGGEGSQASEDAGVAADPTVVLAEADIADIVQPVLDPPMAAD